MTPTTISGGCICCWKWQNVLRKWKLRLWPNEPDLDRVWICEECSALSRAEITARVQWKLKNIDVLPYLEDEPTFWSLSKSPPNLKVVKSDGE